MHKYKQKDKQKTNDGASQATTTSVPAGVEGLTSAEVAERVAKGEVNVDAGIKTRSLADIFRDNICTLFNIVNVILAVLVFITGSYKNMLFMVIIVANVVIGIVQEIRSKMVTDRLSIVAATHVGVLRDGKVAELEVDELVIGDVVRLGRGDQIPSDARIVNGECTVDESLLTGESKPVKKAVGDELMSGSFISSGTIWAKVIHVGSDNYAAKITAEAKKHEGINSEIMTSLNKIIKFVSIAMVPVGLLLFASSYMRLDTGWEQSLLTTVSALIGMIPEGLILLTSTVLAVAVIRLASHKVLVQQLYCIETLARVDVLCLDKTGTITTGAMEAFAVEGIKDVGEQDSEQFDGKLLGLFAGIAASDEDPNATAQAIIALAKKARVKPLACTRAIPFSSDSKWSGAVLNDRAYVMGAAQFVLAGHEETLQDITPQLESLASGSRVLLLAEVDGFTDSSAMEGNPRPLGFVCIRDEIRPTAAQTIKYFLEQGVSLKVISGDDPRTVSGIAQKVGVPGAEDPVDATTLTTSDQIADAIEHHSVFGRVTPEQKKAFVLALKNAGHTVAMTGDGVNDVLALKSSNCSVAMASGSDAARNVAQLVLVDDDFASMPKVVAEGRRSINNLQRSASLFLVKTLFSIATAVLFILLPWEYPFVPIQMTLISAFTIGLPSFVLALEPNHERVRGRFLYNCVVHSIPGAVCAVATVLLLCLVGYPIGLEYSQISTLSVVLFSFIGVMLVIRLSVPYNPIRAALLVVVIGGLMLGCTVFGWFFNIVAFTAEMWILAGIFAAIDLVAFQLLYNRLDYLHRAELEKQV